jgi:hypothetical protein
MPVGWFHPHIGRPSVEGSHVHIRTAVTTLAAVCRGVVRTF